ncbi:diacylglycerol kinase family protein [Streptomyces sp. 3214.6]|uniref:diacylglycerol kinase family protein n=1 Tax=Streptomyces sp. 3214.6 TaxID=1882757 RepID=UPI00090A664B|nr:diacylglycerol kinase family protein [Streptomyces sp. 3214.6]SHI12038.1 Diacylglycerol kinase catalytic domain-containing protein [Streptomyces sp. 3214.6]
MATSPTSDQLLVIIDPVARSMDGESVRIAKDVLSAGAASTKVCLPEDPEEFARVLSRRGSRRPVVVGDDRALNRAVALLHRQRALAECVLSVVPVGASLSIAHALGVPTGAVAAARAALDGAERRLDVLVDDSDGVVLGALRIPPIPLAPRDSRDARDTRDELEASDGTDRTDRTDWTDWTHGTDGAARAGRAEGADGAERLVHGGRHWLRTYQSLVRTLVPSRPSCLSPAPAPPGPARLRIEVDGVTLVDLDQPVAAVSVAPGPAGTAVVTVRPLSLGAEAAPLEARGRTVTVSGADFRYRADTAVAGPVRRRTWTVREGALGLMLPGR